MNKANLTLHHPHRDRILASLRKAGVETVDLVVLTGSGLAQLADVIEVERVIPYTEIDGYPAPRIPGHPGRLSLGRRAGKRVAIFAGRFHRYEGADGAQVTLPVQLAAGLNARAIVLTSSVGAINPSYRIGDVVCVVDHLNMMGGNPLFEMIRAYAGNPFAADEATPFVDLTAAYRRDFYDALSAKCRAAGFALHRGVLAAGLGPMYESPAEVRMLRTLGADAACMSTVPEAIYAAYAGLDVAALALVTNRANDGSGLETPSHHDVLRQAQGYADRLAMVVVELIALL